MSNPNKFLPGLTIGLLALTPALAAQVDPIRPPVHPSTGRIVPRLAEPIHTELARIQVSIQDGTATTEIRQVLRNRGPRPAEATWVLPLPDGAAVDGFTMTMGGEPVESEILDAGKARGIYERIVRQMRDPGLLEYMGYGCLRARVFPVPPQGTTEVTVRYRQRLAETAGLMRYAFPVRALALACGRVPDSVSLDVKIESRRPLKAVFSPLQGVDVSRTDDHHARASLELAGGALPTRDLELFHSVSTEAFGLDFLPWRQQGRPGHFLLAVTPRHEWAEPEGTQRVVQFVIDTSGSMQGEKIAQARRALQFFLGSLRPTDWFNVVPFSTEARPFFPMPVPADEAHRGQASERIDLIEARGGTNIESALGFALSHALPEKHVEGTRYVPITVFLTDGLPTIGETDVERLLKGFRTADMSESRVFVFGVGDDVNTKLLDRVAQDGRGDRSYVRPGQDLEIETSALFDKLSHPVLTDVELVFDGIQVTDLQPARLPDLFKGSRLTVAGRYHGEGAKAIRLRGLVDGQQKEFVYETTFPAEAGEHDFVPVLWAERHVAALLDAIRLNGADPELVAEVRRLGQEFGLATPYTSHLIVEDSMRIARGRGLQVPAPGGPSTPGADARLLLGDDDGEARGEVVESLRRAGRLRQDAGDEAPLEELEHIGAVTRESARELDDLAKAEASGATAVDRSVALRTAADGLASADAFRQRSAASLVSQRVGGRVLVLVGGTWVDRNWTEALAARTRKIEAWSDEWFDLAASRPGLAKLLAFSTRLVLVDGDGALEITPAAE